MTEKLGGERYSVQKPLINYVTESSAEYVTFDIEENQASDTEKVFNLLKSLD